MAAVAMEMEKMRVEQLKTRNRRIWRSTSSRTASSTLATFFFLHDPTSSPKPGSTAAAAADVGSASMPGGMRRTRRALPVHDSPVAAAEDPNPSMNPKTERVPIEQAQLNEIERGVGFFKNWVARESKGEDGDQTKMKKQEKADVTLDDGTFARAAVPSGASTGIYEAFDLRFGVSKAVENINTIIGPALVGKDPTEQAAIDNFMVQQLDGTANEWGWCKKKLGVDAILVVSLAVCKAGAALKRIPLYKHIANLAGNSTLVLPAPTFNVINGGSHAGNKLAMQGFTILPAGALSFKEAMKMGVEVCDHLKAVIMEKYGQVATYFRDTGGFIQKNEEGLELLKTAIENAGYTDKVVIGMDVAASEFYLQDKTYDMNFQEENNDGSQKIPGDALSNVYKSLVCDYAIVSIEDPFDQDDLEHYAKMTNEIGEHVQIVRGDLLGTNLVRVEKAINQKTCNALLLKVDQIGSVTESIEAVKKSKAAGWGVMASCCSLGQQRSIANAFLPKMFCFSECTNLRIGETEDPFIADLSVGLATGQIKTGVPRKSERLAKFNRLLQIEKELGAEAVYAGAHFRKPVEPY